MQVNTTTVAGALSADPALAAAHQRLLTDPNIQFELPFVSAPPTLHSPSWLTDFLNAIANLFGFLGPILRVLFWVGLALVAAALIFVIVRSLMGVSWPTRKRKVATTAEPEWRPDATRARVLLEDADKLAVEGRYAEAAHLLLHRSLDHVRDFRPKALRPAVTSRELAASEDLPGAARAAFSHIAEVVEHSFFGARGVDQAAYADCRRSYEAFAFPTVWS